ncbi:MAG TPA: TIGR03067 domain-containing protein [Planctomycetota bacterium]|nr:TIGR03067 domain-containing protein [Planctomycetota bacterium]
MQRTAAVLALFLCVFPAFAADVNGTWTMVTSEMNGQKVPDEEMKKLSLVLTLKEGKYTTTSAGKQTDSGEYTLNAAAGTFEIRPGEGPRKGTVMKAIYKLEGDTLTVCYDVAGKEFPKEFKTQVDDGRLVAVYKRAAK